MDLLEVGGSWCYQDNPLYLSGVSVKIIVNVNDIFRRWVVPSYGLSTSSCTKSAVFRSQACKRWPGGQLGPWPPTFTFRGKRLCAVQILQYPYAHCLATSSQLSCHHYEGAISVCILLLSITGQWTSLDTLPATSAGTGGDSRVGVLLSLGISHRRSAARGACQRFHPSTSPQNKQHHPPKKPQLSSLVHQTCLLSGWQAGDIQIKSFQSMLLVSHQSIAADGLGNKFPLQTPPPPTPLQSRAS